jgi:cytochrome b561
MREALKALHDPAGTVVFALILVRLVWRSSHTPPETPSGPVWERYAAKVSHVVLYVMMIAVPLAGIAATFARGKPIDFGLFQLSLPFDATAKQSIAGALKEVHGSLGQAILVLAFLHAAAALWHHYVREDDVLMRMLPRKAVSIT